MDAYKFSECAREVCPDLLRGKTPEEFLKSSYWRGCNSGLMNLRSAGCYKIAGWCFDFTPYLKRFVVKQYGSWHEYYAPNKTLLRKSLYGTIQKIVEIEA